MRTGQSAFLCTVILIAAGRAAPAQDFNIDVGLGFGTPGSSHGGAAGQPGVWNELDMSTPWVAFALNDTSGAATGVDLVYLSGGNGNLAFNNAGTSGDDEALMDDFVDVGSNEGDTVEFRITGLESGTYDVYVNAWAPDNGTGFLSNVAMGPGGSGTQPCGGAPWSGSHVAGETYVVDTVTAVHGIIEVRVFVNAVGSSATCNGIQIVQQPACPGFVKYCTAGTSSNGCRATISALGVPSATATSGFNLVVENAEGFIDLIFFWGKNGRQANPWGTSSSYLCIVPPAVRGGLLLPHTGTKGSCDQVQTQDLNALWCSTCPQPAKNPGPGATLQAQSWYRDPFSTSNQTTAMSDAIEFTVCP